MSLYVDDGAYTNGPCRFSGYDFILTTSDLQSGRSCIDSQFDNHFSNLNIDGIHYVSKTFDATIELHDLVFTDAINVAIPLNADNTINYGRPLFWRLNE